MSKCFYITTAIDYVNGHPHLGHAYEKVVADVIARAHRSLGQETFFLTGLDEHGQKVQQAAVTEGKTPQAYCDGLAEVWKAFAAKLDLTNDDFVRTTELRHKEVVQAILAKLHAEGHFYKEVYRGFYSTRQETFLTHKDRLPDGTFDPSWGEVIELEEENYYFRLKDHQQWLIEHIERNPSFIAPAQRRNEVLGFLKNNVLEDLCISRPASRLNWGIPLPFDPDYVTYVWFDALSNYITIPAAQGDPGVPASLRRQASAQNLQWRVWPADIHLIGKDIVKFHSVYWPIMLKAMGAPLPKQVLAHGWWQKDGQRMSKSTGNVVDPVAVIDEWGVDAFRFYVLRELDIGPDGNWTEAGFKARYSSELANGLGNLVNRSLSMLKRYRSGVVPKVSNELALEAEQAIAETRRLLAQNQLQGALQAIWSLVTRANQYVDHTAPFKLAKDQSKAARLDEVLYNLAEICRILAVLLWPFLPGTASKIYAQLGLAGSPDKDSEARWGGLAGGHAIGTPAPLFPRKES
ncbi:MAG TPA: methionine--tRNA ligase [Candidatus Paceibacterota bacterium]|nr:methionine--tRNA ligase [Verrucomicrobiota bacterium]HSA10218.1 methionine--tRNA ligase [Candidatus Paceibacterota bacterium]